MAHTIQYPRFVSTFTNIKNNQWRPYDEQKKIQENQLKKMIEYAYNYVPYYHKLFKKNNLLPENIKKIEDLEKIPTLSKEIITSNWEEFVPYNLHASTYSNHYTGGTTGTPFKYRLGNIDRFIGASLLYRGWSYGGYNLGERIIFLAGSSLGIDNKSNVKNRTEEFLRNIKKLSSFDMGDKEFLNYAQIIAKFKPKYIRGYASAIYFFANWIDEKGYDIQPIKSIYTTSEKLYPHMRKKIYDVLGCEVYDNYGLNDGGVSAYECKEHAGLHIDTERSIMELVDSNDCNIYKGKGRILATSLFNYALPFIRYETGDEAIITEDTCECGRNGRMLEEIIGRTVDQFVSPEGKYVHGWFFLYIFWELGESIKEYQVVQKSITDIVIYLSVSDNFNYATLEKITKYIHSKSQNWKVTYKFVDKIDRTKSGKYKFIINEMFNKKNIRNIN